MVIVEIREKRNAVSSMSEKYVRSRLSLKLLNEFMTHQLSCKIQGFHGGDYEGCRLMGYKIPVRTSQETRYFSAAGPSRLVPYRI
jgi:hypothetical protein